MFQVRWQGMAVAEQAVQQTVAGFEEERGHGKGGGRSLSEVTDNRLSVVNLLRAWGALATGHLVVLVMTAFFLTVGVFPVVQDWVVKLPFQNRLAMMHSLTGGTLWLLAFAAWAWIQEGRFRFLHGRAEARRRGALLLGWGLSLGAWLALLLESFTGADVVLSSYVSYIRSPIFVAALLCYVAGVFLTGMAAGHSLAGWSRIPFLVGLISLVLGAIDAWSSEAHSGLEFLFWGPGHLLPFVFAGMLVWSWLKLGELMGLKGLSEGRWPHILMAAAALPSLAGLVFHALWGSHDIKVLNAYTQLMRWGTWPAILLAFLTVLSQAFLPRSRARFWSLPGAAFLASALVMAMGIYSGIQFSGRNSVLSAHTHGMLVGIGLAAFVLLLPRYAQHFYRSHLPEDAGKKEAGSDVTAAAEGRDGNPGESSSLRNGAVWGLWGFALSIGLMIVGLHRVLLSMEGESVEVVIGAVLAVVFFVWGGAWAVMNVVRSPVPWPVIGQVAVFSALMVAVASFLFGRQEERTPLFALFETPLRAAAPADSHMVARNKEEIALRFQQGVQMMQIGQYDYAVTAFERILALAPKLPEAHTNLGYALLEQREYEKAMEHFNAALEVRSRQDNAYYGLALSYAAQGRYSEALGAMGTFTHFVTREHPNWAKAHERMDRWRAILREFEKNQNPELEKQREAEREARNPHNQRAQTSTPSPSSGHEAKADSPSLPENRP